MFRSRSMPSHWKGMTQSRATKSNRFWSIICSFIQFALVIAQGFRHFLIYRLPVVIRCRLVSSTVTVNHLKARFTQWIVTVPWNTFYHPRRSWSSCMRGENLKKQTRRLNFGCHASSECQRRRRRACDEQEVVDDDDDDCSCFVFRLSLPFAPDRFSFLDHLSHEGQWLPKKSRTKHSLPWDRLLLLLMFRAAHMRRVGIKIGLNFSLMSSE